MQRNEGSLFIPLLVLALFVLLLLPIVAPETETFMNFLAYIAMVLPFLRALAGSKYQFLSLIIVSTVIHMVGDACNELDRCVAAYDDARWADIDDYFTNYAMTHLLFVVAFNTAAVEIAVPILVFISLLSVNLGFQSLFLILIGLICLVRGILRISEYYLADLIGFVVMFLTASVIFFMDYEKRFFIFFYALSFAFATTVKRNTNHFLAFLMPSDPKYKPVEGMREDL
ncbi:MAG: hypothetical protein CMH46_00735 [Muricauda sp.]|nr:hypothetical protein [Allomuricauda sp.]